MSEKNPKQENTRLWSCRPQTGKCPNGCNQCFYNRPGAYYCDINEPNIPDPQEVGSDIVRMNSGHDSNINRNLVIETASKYENVFFNTAIPQFDFPGPVVFTANAKEEETAWVPWSPWTHYDTPNVKVLPEDQRKLLHNLMFVRLRVSSTNLGHISEAVRLWTNAYKIPVVLTFMAYYSQDPPKSMEIPAPKVAQESTSDDSPVIEIYRWRKRHINSYWCPTSEFMIYVLEKMKQLGGRRVTMCGTPDRPWCKDCHTCESYYWLTKKHIMEQSLGIDK